MSSPRPDSSAERTVAPSEATRTTVSLVLAIHLLIVAIVLSANLAPSPLQTRLKQVLRPYAQLLNLDPDFTRFHLTHATEDDVDHRLELLPVGADPAADDQWLVLGADRFRGGEAYRRYGRLARLVALFVDEDETTGLVAKSVAESILNQTEVQPQQIRCRQHMLVGWDAFEPTTAPPDPNAANYFRVVYGANTIVTDRQVDIVKIDDASQVARPEASAANEPRSDEKGQP